MVDVPVRVMGATVAMRRLLGAMDSAGEIWQAGGLSQFLAQHGVFLLHGLRGGGAVFGRGITHELSRRCVGCPR